MLAVVLAVLAVAEGGTLVRLAAHDGTVTIMFSDIEGSTALNAEPGGRHRVHALARERR